MLFCGTHLQKREEGTYYKKPFPGLVPDKETAVAIATAVFKPMFGKTTAADYVFSARLEGDDWIEIGDLKPGMREKVDGNLMRPSFKILKINGQISKVTISPG